MAEALLPNSSGPATRALAYTFDTYGRFAYQIDRVKNIGITDTPDDWVPWLIYDQGLEDVIPYVRTFRKVLAEGPAWQARRGTDAGIAIGIGWVESEGQVAPPDGRHRWWEFQVGFTDPATDIDQLRQLFGIINLSKASEDELFRMFSPDYDLRPVRMDQHRYDQSGIMDDYSGAPRWDGGPYISFGSDKSTLLDMGTQTDGGTIVVVTRKMDYFDGYRFDRDTFGQKPSKFFDATLEVERTRDVLVFEDTWNEDAWDDRPWGMTGGMRLFMQVISDDSGTIELRYTDDEWHDEYPVESWNESVGSKPIKTKVETT